MLPERNFMNFIEIDFSYDIISMICGHLIIHTNLIFLNHDYEYFNILLFQNAFYCNYSFIKETAVSDYKKKVNLIIFLSQSIVVKLLNVGHSFYPCSISLYNKLPLLSTILCFPFNSIAKNIQMDI